MRTYLFILIIGLAAGLVGGVVSATALQPYLHNNESLIRDFYRTENAVHVSPHSLRKKIMENKNDFILVDLRSPQEYEKEHIAGAVNIAAYKDPDHSAYDEVDRIVSGFQALQEDKTIIVYCYSMPCMTGRKIGQMLTEHDIYVQHLGIGWNEWRYFWNLWNHEVEWDKTKVEDYVVSGKEPGSFRGTPVITPCTEGQFGC
ncbi:MAG: rhodanese-like domain-containing protein [Candidatus Peribacteraceae bacterium]|nr:rhodanese-like domain-containing protein [Candidatus Peribacteraceae bacterium]